MHHELHIKLFTDLLHLTMAKYFKQEMPDLRNMGEKKFYYRMKVNENIDFDELVRRLTYPGSGLDKGQVVQVIAAIGKQMALEMASGNSVTIDGIGTFRASVGMTMPKELTGTDAGKETNARSLKVTGIIYRAASQLVRTISSQCTLVRDKEHRLRKSPYSKEERIGLAVGYLGDGAHPFMRVGDYARLTRQSHCAASRELQEISRTPQSPIRRDGRASALVYVLSREQL